VRIAILVLWIAVLIVILLPFFRRRGLPHEPPRGSLDELVKDPVCGTYVVRSRAVSRTAADGSHYFCSRECASRFVG
jgi:YHS domain-containing protein